MKRVLSSSSRHLAIYSVVAILLSACDGGTSLSNSGGDNETPLPSNDDVALKAEPAGQLIKSSLLEFYASETGSFNGGILVDGPFPVSLEQESSSADSDASGGGDRFSSTNVQEAGVDEADRVKIDGDVLFSLENRGNFVTPTILVDDAIEIAPVDGLSIAPRVETQTLSAYRLDADNSTVLSRTELELGNHTPQGMYVHRDDSGRQLVMLSRGSFDIWGGWYDTYSWSNLDTKITWFDASDAQNISVKRELQLDGQLISSRKIGDRLIVVTRYTPQPVGIVPYPYTAEDLETNRRVIESADVADLLPGYQVVENGEASSSQPVVDNNECYSSRDTSQSDAYPSPNVISIITIDLAGNDIQLNSSCFLGDSETLYVSTESLYLATTRYDYQVGQDDLARPFIVDYNPEITTEIHKFSLGGVAPVFKGSSSVSGHLGWYPDRKPYRMSESDGNLRIVSFDQNRDGSPVTLTILTEGQGEQLRTVATLPNDNRPENIGKVGENLYASRFFGDKAYLVTFRVTDPLYILDLSNPADPRIAGELEIPGYSDYLHIVNDGLLLGVGKDAIASSQNDPWGDGRGAWYQGVKLALFDVSNPASPSTADSIVIGKRGTESPALSQPHSFAWLPSGDGRNARFAMPLSLHDGATGIEGEDPNQPWAWAEWTSNQLLTMEINEASNLFEDVADWIFESRAGGFQWSPVNLYDDRAVIGSAGDLYVVHNGTLFYGQWGSENPASAAQ